MLQGKLGRYDSNAPIYNPFGTNYYSDSFEQGLPVSGSRYDPPQIVEEELPPVYDANDMDINNSIVKQITQQDNIIRNNNEIKDVAVNAWTKLKGFAKENPEIFVIIAGIVSYKIFKVK